MDQMSEHNDQYQYKVEKYEIYGWYEEGIMPKLMKTPNYEHIYKD